MIGSARMARSLTAGAMLLLALALAGCSTKFLYNNADRVAVWAAEDYVDLDRAQKRWLRQRMREHLYRHRREQLPQWVTFLREFDADVAESVTEAELEQYRRRALELFDAVMVELAPTAVGLVLTLDEATVAALPERLTEANAELLEEYAELDAAERRQRWIEETVERLEDWIGPVQPRQRLLVEATASELVIGNEARVGYRERWQAALLRALGRRQDRYWLSQVLPTLLLHPEAFWTPAYRAEREQDEPAYLALGVSILNSLDERQLGHLSDRLDDLADDLDDLARASVAVPAPAGPPPVGG